MSDSPFWLRFLLAVLATWRVTHLLASEDGPADTIARFRAWLGPTVIGRMMDCFNCLSLTVAALAAVFVSQTPLDWLACCLALSGGACLLERFGRDPLVIQPISQAVEGEVNNVLRSETRGATQCPTERPTAEDEPELPADYGRH